MKVFRLLAEKGTEDEGELEDDYDLGTRDRGGRKDDDRRLPISEILHAGKCFCPWE
jgi:hypothetical protein